MRNYIISVLLIFAPVCAMKEDEKELSQLAKEPSLRILTSKILKSFPYIYGLNDMYGPTIAMNF